MPTRELPALEVPETPPEAPPPADAPPRAPRRRRRLLWGLAIVTALLAVWFGVSAVLLSSSIDRIPKEELPSLAPVGDGPTNYLLVGSDSRRDLSPELGGFFGDFPGERADVIMVAHVAGGRVQLLGVPRDLKVSIPGHGVNKVNAAYAFGGPDLLVHTVSDNLGIPIHRYVEVGFGDFAEVVDRMGGVDLEFPYAARDNKSGLSVEAGTTHVGGVMALAYVRSRNYEELRDGSWVAVDQGDIGRIARQQLVLSKLLAAARSPRSLFTLPWLAAGVGTSLTADSGLSIGDLSRLGWATLRSGDIDSATLPVRTSDEGGVSYVVRIEPAAEDLVARFTRGDLLEQAG